VSALIKLVTKARTFGQLLKFHERGIEFAAKSARANRQAAVEYFHILTAFLGKMSASDAGRL